MTVTPALRTAARVVVLSLAMTVLGGTGIASAKDHSACVINKDDTPNAPNHGICVVVPLPVGVGR